MIPEELLVLSVPSFGEMMRKGQALMIPLLVLITLSGTIVVDRAIFWIFGLRGILRERRLVQEYLSTGHALGLQGFLKARMGAVRVGRLLESGSYCRVLMMAERYPGVDARWEDELEAVQNRFDRFLSFLTLIAGLGTSFGLLGTVIGVSKSMAFIESDFSATVSGLSVALYTTIGGLVVSILSLAAYGLFASFGDLLGRSIAGQVAALHKREVNPGPMPRSEPAALSELPRSTGLDLPSGPAGYGPGPVPREDTLAITPTELSSGNIIIEES